MWQQGSYSDTIGSHPYFVYTPENYRVGTAVPLLVMLHGCTQTAIDFATGTHMNQLAEQYNFVVVYPQQTTTYNQNLCWNWFIPANQVRDRGEPASIFGIVQTIKQDTTHWTIDPARVYVAGLSAGAAMAVILGATYPDLFAAIGVHSGLEYHAATSLTSGLKAMRRAGPDPVQQGQLAYDVMGSYARVVPSIVFHGTQDAFVAPANGDQVVQQWIQTNQLASSGIYEAAFTHPTTATPGQVAGGRSYITATWKDRKGNDIQTYWKVGGMGHAWSGGNPTGSYTDPLGPSASEAMYAFFMNHPMPGSASESDTESRERWSLRRILAHLLFSRKEG